MTSTPERRETASTNDKAPLDPVDPNLKVEDEDRALRLRELTRIRRALATLVFVALGITCYFAKDILLPLILGLMLALTLSPAVRLAGRWGIPPPVTAVTLIFSLGIGLSVGGYAMSGPVSTWLEDAPELGSQLKAKLEGLSDSVSKVQEASAEVEAMTETSTESVQRVSIDQPGFLNSAVSNATDIIAKTTVTLVLALFVLASGEMFYVKLVESFPRMSEKKRALKIVYGVEKSISRYLLTITLINAGLGVVVGGLMTLVGLPNAYIWGVIAFVFNFLPFIGAIAGVILVGIYSVIQFDQLGYAFLAPALYLAATSLEGQLITPTIVGRRLELNTVSVFVTVVFWGWLWGIAGVLMAVPFLVIVKVICDNVDELQTLGNFLGSASTKVEVEAANGSKEAAEVV